MLAWVSDPRASAMNEIRLGRWITLSFLPLLRGYQDAVAEREQAFEKELKRQEN
jgi:hypothetical protein